MDIIKKSWWKILGVVLVLYVLFMGFLTPINSGIYAFSPGTATAGLKYNVDITGYNTHFTDTTTIAWLKLPDNRLLRADSFTATDDMHGTAIFDIPMDLDIPTEGGIMSSLIVDNNRDGYALYPQGVRIKPAPGNTGSSNARYYHLDELKKRSGFAFPFRNILYETIRNTFFHVAIWFAMFLLLIYSCYCSARYLYSKEYDYDLRSSALTTVALWFGVAGILTGSMWAKFTWGTFWTSDVKLNMSAVALLIYFAYWILRRSISDVDARARIAAVYNIFAFICLMVLVMVIPRLTDSLHPGNGGNPALGGEDLDNTLRMVFYPAIIGYTLLGLWMSELYYRILGIELKMTVTE